MAPDRINLTLDIQANDVGSKRVNVRGTLLISTLITAIKDKFNLDGNFEVRQNGVYQALPVDTPLVGAGVSEGGTLVVVRLVEATGTLDIIRRGERLPFSKRFRRAYFQEDRTLSEYDLLWQPAVIGRRDHRNPSNNRLLAVDLEGVEPLPTVSRHHACVVESNGSFFLEDIQGRNPIYVDGKKIAMGYKQPLAAGSIVQLGRITLKFVLIS